MFDKKDVPSFPSLWIVIRVHKGGEMLLSRACREPAEEKKSAIAEEISTNRNARATKKS